jgi:hypothetical protein
MSESINFDASFSSEHSDPQATQSLFQALDSVLAPNSCAYVAGPLESGKAYYERLAAGDLGSVREENEKRIGEVVLRLRTRLLYPVFDSGRLKIPGWSGKDYDLFFREIIRRYAKECWFVDGWEYSTGSTKEFLFCFVNTTPCLDESGTRLTVDAGIRLIRDAADFVSGMKLNDAKLRSRIVDLNRLREPGKPGNS